VFLTDVRVPATNRVGEENDGWRVAMVTFSFERGTAFVGELAQTGRLLGGLVDVAKQIPRGSGTAWDDPGVRREVGRLAADVDALWALTKRNVTQSEQTGRPGIGVSVSKLHYSELRHRLGDLAMVILGHAGMSFDDLAGLEGAEHVRGGFYAMSISIAAGTSQVQRNIVAERILGLPREAPG
jgi:alkylation response protein AidB-like acyl-CoA dehydrogenase